MSKKRLLFCFILLLICCLLSACEIGGDEKGEHVHSYSEWEVSVEASCTVPGTEKRTCSDCGFSEYAEIPVIGHLPTKIPAVPATCTSPGKTEGTRCDTCNVTLTEQAEVTITGHSFGERQVATAATCTVPGNEKRTCTVCGFSEYSEIPVTGHHPQNIPAVAATCTKDGKTGGSRCSVCGKILTEPKTVSAKGHSYKKEEVETPATCTQEGTIRYTCTTCSHSYTKRYSLPTYTATELYDQSIQYVGEIITYNKSGAELSLGTGFVISSDGKVVTNYHVIDGAYAAKININGKTYSVSSVLAYSEHIDLAVLQIPAAYIPYAPICKNPVKTGSTVYAIGSSRGMTNTYSKGIITHADREVEGVMHLQHDASITNGNSGGPLINEYGEVIGINTWTFTASQNLNFAVATSELDNLVYGEALSLADFSEKEAGDVLYDEEPDAFIRMKTYIREYGTYYEEDRMYVLALGTLYDEYSLKHTRAAYYYEDDNLISLDYLVNDGLHWGSFYIDESLSGIYEWEYFDEYGFEMSGSLEAETYTSDTKLEYSYHNISSGEMLEKLQTMASAMVYGLSACVDADFAIIGVTSEDLGFYHLF